MFDQTQLGRNTEVTRLELEILSEGRVMKVLIEDLLREVALACVDTPSNSEALKLRKKQLEEVSYSVLDLSARVKSMLR